MRDSRRNGLPYYKAYPRDYFEGTIGMPLELKGAYRLVLDLIYMTGGALPDDPHFISVHLGCSVRKWNSIRKQLIERGKIEAADGKVSNYRADRELEITRTFQAKQAENRRGSRKNNTLQEPPKNGGRTIQNQNQNQRYNPPLSPPVGGEPTLFGDQDDPASQTEPPASRSAPKAEKRSRSASDRGSLLPPDWRLPKEWGD